MGGGMNVVIGSVGVKDSMLGEIPPGLVDDGCIVPAQWFASQGSSRVRSPEQELWTAVLNDALDIIRHGMGTTAKSRNRFIDACLWLHDEGGDDTPGSVVFVTQVLGINLSQLRKSVRRHQVTDLPRRSAVGR